MLATGTGVMRESVKASRKKAADICGTIVFSEGNEQGKGTGAWVVQFFTDAKRPRVAYQVRLAFPEGGGPVKKDFQAFTPPRKPSDGELLLFRAICTAIVAVPDRPNQPVHPVVLPAVVFGEEGLMVYLLADTDKDNVAVLGKHYRVLVSLDGRTVRKVEPLSRDVLETELGPTQPDGTRPYLYVTHQLSDYPLETHVFISKLHQTDLYVLTNKCVWRIHDGAIQLDSMNK
jgi:hypothetical protein